MHLKLYLMKVKLISGFSLKSVDLKKQSIIKSQKKSKKIFLESSFNIDDLMTHWSNYLHKIESNGSQNMLAILKMDSPKVTSEFNIEFGVANSINKIELNKELESMLPYLRDNLNNHKIQFKINIIERSNESFIYTSEEKYHKMKIINSAVGILKKTFDLDI